MLNTSATNQDRKMSPPALKSTAPSSSRRGHAHRRSGAVSNHDLSDVLRPSFEPKGSSLPATPSNPKDESNFSALLVRSTSQPEVTSSGHSFPSPATGESAYVGGQPRARVGFSDTLEFIPRPLSTISSDTSSSLSTVRASHSVTGSITSIVSNGASSPPPNRLQQPSIELAGSEEEKQPKAKTTGRKIVNASPNIARAQEIPLTKWPSHAQRIGDQSTSTDIAGMQGSDVEYTARTPNLMKDTANKIDSSNIDPASEASEFSRFRGQQVVPKSSRPWSSPEPKILRKQRKVKSWAGSILSRRTRSPGPFNGHLEATSSALSLHAFAPSLELSAQDIDFDHDTTCVIRDSLHIPTAIQPEIPPYNSLYRDEGPAPMLDLDAAFRSDLDDTTNGGFPPARRRMHSSGATGIFSGPGMHYHRRAESAPELVPVDLLTFGIPRSKSNPGMADVFEEEEEEEYRISNEQSQTSRESIAQYKACEAAARDTSLELGMKTSDTGTTDGGFSQSAGHHRNVGPLLGGDKVAVEPQHMQACAATPGALASAKSSTFTQPPVEIVEANEEPRASLAMKRSEDASITQLPSNDSLFVRPMSAPLMDFTVTEAIAPYTNPETFSSAVSSPECARTSLDALCPYTTDSSIIDRATLNLYRSGDQVPGFRESVDDVPSLTSSASTMISAQPPRVSGSAYTVSSAERSSSLSAAIPPLASPSSTGKRSSLASLSRLVGTSYGERSKLNIEEQASLENIDKVAKKKGSRISRLMRFWKSKERPAS